MSIAAFDRVSSSGVISPSHGCRLSVGPVANDVDGLSAIENAVFSTDRISRRSFGRLLRSASASVLVAAEGDVIAGYVILLFRSGSSRARLYSIAAAPGKEGAGIGRLLLGAAEDEAARRAAAALRLETRADNSRAIGLYERNGYRRFGRLDVLLCRRGGSAALRKELPPAARPMPASAGSVRQRRNRPIVSGVCALQATRPWPAPGGPVTGSLGQ